MLIEFESLILQLTNAERNKLETVIASKRRNFLEKFANSQIFKDLSREIRYLIENKVAFARKIGPTKKEVDLVTWKVNFSHKILEEINIQSLYNLKEVRQLLPTQLKTRRPFRKVFTYGRTIGSKILNYNKCLKEAGELTYDQMMSMTCDCESSDFVNSHHGHIITGDLNIVRDERLRKVCSYGTKFREIPRLNVDLVKENLKKDIDTLASSLARK